MSMSRVNKLWASPKSGTKSCCLGKRGKLRFQERFPFFLNGFVHHDNVSFGPVLCQLPFALFLVWK